MNRCQTPFKAGKVSDTCAADWPRVVRKFGQADGCTIERLGQDQVEALCDFFARAYADRPLAQAFSDRTLIRRRWTWWHEGNPARLDAAPQAWVCRRQGQIIGHMAALPAVALVNGRPLPVCWGADLIVAPERRRHGLGPVLVMTLVQAMRQPVMIAGTNEDACPMFRRLGFADWGRLPLYVRVLRPRPFFDTMPWPPLVRRVTAAGWQAAGRVASRAPLSRPGAVVPLERFDERFDRWWQPIERTFPGVIRRTSDTMTWRYHQHPHHHYQAFGAMSAGALRGVVVLRHGRSRGLPTGFITELLADPNDQQTMGDLLAHAQEVFTAHAQEAPVFIRCAVLPGAFGRALRRAGFLRVPSPIHWMVAHADGPSGLSDLAGRDGWFLNAGDSDLDVV